LAREAILGAAVHLREVVKEALRHNAAEVILWGTTIPQASLNPATPTSSSPAGFAKRYSWSTFESWTT
jgi:hypothetical protein